MSWSGTTTPPRKTRAGVAGQPCVQPDCDGTLVERDCACTWGCDLCWVAYRCNKCNGAYRAPGSVKRPLKPPKQKCPRCGKGFRGLTQHLEDAHGVPRPGYKKCPKCGAIKHPIALRQHLRDKHGVFP